MKDHNINLTADELSRYIRQLSLNEIGLPGQTKLKNSKVLCVGAGGLGSSSLIYLAGAGIGTLGIIDDDNVELSNLHRQLIYSTSQINLAKTEAAKERINAINPNINIITYNAALSLQNALDIIKKYDIVLDGTDNFTAKYLINDACLILKKPNIFASIYQFQGQLSVFTREGPCYRCLYPHYPEGYIPNCEQAGVLGALPGLLGTIQAIEAIKLILGIGKPLIGKVLTIDALSMQFLQLSLKQSSTCEMHHSSIEKIPLKQENIQYDPSNKNVSAISATDLMVLLKKNDKTLQLLDVRQAHEHQASNIGGLVIPLNELQSRHNELDPTQKTVIYCHTGPRSRKAASILLKLGFASVLYLKGGTVSYTSHCS